MHLEQDKYRAHRPTTSTLATQDKAALGVRVAITASPFPSEVVSHETVLILLEWKPPEDTALISPAFPMPKTVTWKMAVQYLTVMQ